MRSAYVALFVMLTACGESLPASCESMCESAADAYGACLSTWESEWSDAGYANREDFLDACQTWAWEMLTLEEAGKLESTEEECAARDASLETGGCDAWLAMTWGGV